MLQLVCLVMVALWLNTVEAKMCQGKPEEYFFYIEEDHNSLQRIASPMDPGLSDQEKLGEITRLTIPNVKILESIVRTFKRRLGLTSADTKFGTKLPERILAKARRPSVRLTKPWHNIEHIRDALRFKARLRSVEDIPIALNIALSHGLKLIKIDTDKLFQPKEYGWRFVGFDFRMPNGQIVEFYMPPYELDVSEVKHLNHALFEKWRNQPLEEVERKWLYFQLDVQESRQRYDLAWNRFLKRNNYSSDKELYARWKEIVLLYDLDPQPQCPWVANPGSLMVCKTTFYDYALNPFVNCPEKHKPKNITELEDKYRQELLLQPNIGELVDRNELMTQLETDLLSLQNAEHNNHEDLSVYINNALRSYRKLKKMDTDERSQ